ncbi:MAG TPA: hypothetical protein VFQ20_08010 [Burkholderiaceae bacterium]|nr:hypothetical protein [Burkholderiaceae bacterium]
MNATAPHLSTEALLDYWLGDAGSAATDAADEHLMQCDACGQALDELVALGQGIRDAWRAGTVGGVFSSAFVQRLAAQGLRVREYRLVPGGSVNCTVAPSDELLVSHLALPPLQGVQRLDLRVEGSLQPGVRHELHDIPFDPLAGEVLYVSKVADVRPLPAHTLQATLLAVDDAGARELGRYVFNHRPWTGTA